jgi:hypothetical protein
MIDQNCGDTSMGKNAIKLTLAALFAACILISTSSAFGVTGAIFEKDVSPGEDLVHIITVINGENDSSQNMTAEVVGYVTNKGGANVALMPEDDTGIYTARPFLSVEPASFTLGPGETKTVRLTGRVPEDVGSGGRYASVLIKPEPKPAKGGNIRILTAIQVLVLLTIKDSEIARTGEISNLSANKTDDGLSVEFLFKNTGNVGYKPRAEAELLDRNGDVVASFGPEVDRVLPTNSRIFKFKIVPEKQLAPGTYEIKATAKLDNDTVLAAQKTTLVVD